MQAMSRATFAAAAMLLAAVAGHSTPLMAVLSLTPFDSAQGDLELVERSKDGRAALYADTTSERSTVASAHARQELPDGPGKAELTKLCSGCHDLMFTASTRETEEGWTRIVNDMRSKGADGTEEEFAKVIAYLTAHMGKGL